MTIRNEVFDALLALADVRWGNDEAFVERSRRLKMWDKAPVPGLYQIEGTETVASLDGQLDKHSQRASWIIYHRGGKDQAATPAQTSNAILDAIEAAFRPALPGARQTLGGLAYRAFIDGTIHKDNGDLDGQAMLIVPITIILP
jgi:hypothetical protein